MDIAREILEKHLSKDLDIKSYLRTSPLTYQVILDAMEEAINYTHCCKELKNDIKFERKSSARVFNNEKGIWEFI